MKTAFGDVLRTKFGVMRDVTVMVVSPSSAGGWTGVVVLSADDDSRRSGYWPLGSHRQIIDEDMERFEPAPPSHVIEDQEMAARLGITEIAKGWRFAQAQYDAQNHARIGGYDPLARPFDKNGRPLP